MSQRNNLGESSAMKANAKNNSNHVKIALNVKKAQTNAVSSNTLANPKSARKAAPLSGRLTDLPSSRRQPKPFSGSEQLNNAVVPLKPKDLGDSGKKGNYCGKNISQINLDELFDFSVCASLFLSFSHFFDHLIILTIFFSVSLFPCV